MAKIKKDSQVSLFLELANPDTYGASRKVSVDEFVGRYKRLKLGNGGSWCRDDGSLGREYIIHRIKKGNAITAVQLMGLNKKNRISKQIRSDIVKAIQKHKCSVLFISGVEADHKDGRRDDYENFKLENQTLEQFQPLSQAVNKAKRQHCKNCRNTKKRFDATVLGFSKATWTGNGVYRGTCVGCYWHDIKKFNEEISK